VTLVARRQLSLVSNGLDSAAVTPMVRTEDLVDAQEVAELLGLSHPNSVSTYQRRYLDMPRPVIDLGAGRPKLWLRPQVQSWMDTRAR
jgi:predicted DNA-binding transcriptional regulator AlpA